MFFNIMDELCNQDFKDILSLSEVAFSCNTMSDLQDHTLLKIQEFVGADSSVYFDVNRTSLGWQFIDGASYGVPERAPRTWCNHYQKKDPFTNQLLQQVKFGGKKIITSDETINHSDFIRTKFYCDFLRPQSIYHMMTVALHDGSRPIGLIGLHRTSSSTSFSTKEISKINTIIPCLSSAVQKIKLSYMAAERNEIINALSIDPQHEGFMILNHNLLPTFLDEKARNLLEMPEYIGHEIIKTIGNTLPPKIIQCCQDLLKKIHTGQDNPLDQHINFTIEHLSRSISGYVYAYETQNQNLSFLVCFKERDANLINADSFSKYNLTRREIDIIHLVSVGMTNPQISEKLFISIRTVQNHLRSIYSKVDVHNRTSLVSKLIQQN